MTFTIIINIIYIINITIIIYIIIINNNNNIMYVILYIRIQFVCNYSRFMAPKLHIDFL